MVFSLTQRNVAIVDDVQEIRNLVSQVLKKSGYDVVFKGKSGEEIVEAIVSGKLADYNLDIALLDYHMGSGIDGLETAIRIKKHIPTTKIIIVSAETKIKNEVLMAGLSFFSKPFSIAEFLDLMGRSVSDEDQRSKGLGLTQRVLFNDSRRD